ncbi:MAG: hypothetical protein ABIY48_00870, partial [Acidimicrobiales bacterium]
PGPARAPVKKATAAPTPASVRPPADASPSPSPASAVASPSGPAAGIPTLDELAQAWSDSVLPGLKQGTRAMFLTGRFVEPEAGSAVFALANGPTRDHCEKKRPEVEAALAAHFGRPVPLRLVAIAEEAGSATSASRPGPAPRSAAGGDDEEIDDVHALEDAPTAASGAERLVEAFPGAELVDEQ